MIEEMKKHLAELGLSSKEADVYLTMLQLGPAPIQEIARRSDVNRSTTYLLMESLGKHGLVSSFEKGKKVFFIAESPERLMTLMVNQLSAVQSKQDRLNTCLPGLLALFNAIADKPRLRFFEGAEALGAIRQEIIRRHEPVWEVSAIDDVCVALANLKKEARIELSERVRKGRVLMAIKAGFTPPYFNAKGFEIRTMDYLRFPFSGTFTLSGNVLYVITTQARALGLVIESKEVTDMFRALYEAAWMGAKPWTPPKGWASIT